MDDCDDPCPGYPDDNCGNESKDLVIITEGIPEPSQTGIGEGSGSNSASKSSGLAGGAIAGIVIGVVGGVALIIAALLWFFKRRRNDSLPSTDASPPVVTPSTGTSNMAFNAQYGIYDPMVKAGAVGAAGGFMDARMRNSSDIYDSADRRSNVSLRDDQDYSRPVLRLANPDPDN
ncbi:hypothetical protein KEM56_004860 [Ascosphaera pollenicola]|nr:hypothetical protein KEM56_004860 [Ascosphaera pollenicola]